jgi:hypothetical protein
MKDDDVYLNHIMSLESGSFRRRMHRWTVDASASLNQDQEYFWNDEFED